MTARAFILSFFFVALPGSYVVTWATTRLAYAFDWHYAYIAVLLLLLFCMLLTLVFVEHHPIRRIYPLYQMDWPGLLLLACTLLLVNYIAVYGKVEDWFESVRIRGAVVLLPVTLFGFLRRELYVKRPVVPYRIFRSRAFLKGQFFFIMLGVFLPSSIQNSFTKDILHFEAIRDGELNLYLIPGAAAGAVFAWLWYYYKKDPDVLLFAGFLAFELYYLILYQRLAIGLGPEDFWLPSLFKGLGIILLYVCIGLYTVSRFMLPDLLKAVAFMIITRSVVASGGFTGLYSYLIYSGSVRHLDRLAGLVGSGDYIQNQPAGAYLQTITQQAALAAFKEMTGDILLFGLILLAAMATSIFYRRVLLRGRIFNQ